MCRVILYCRVSTDEQSEGCSLDIQERYLRAQCLNRGDDVVDVYREDYSAKGHELNRPEFKKLYTYCQKHRGEVDKVLFLRWDRYSRNVEFAFVYKRKLVMNWALKSMPWSPPLTSMVEIGQPCSACTVAMLTLRM